MRESCDVGLIVALDEEFERILPNNYDSEYDRRTRAYFYQFELGLGNHAYTCTATLIGGMGPERSALQTEYLYSKYNPAIVINIGIAGSLSDDLRLCDVLVATQVDGYMSSSKVSDDEEAASSYRIEPSGEVFRCTRDYIVHTDNLRFSHGDAFKSLTAASSEGLQRHLDLKEIESLAERKLIREAASIQSGHLASGPSVVSSNAFVEWLKARDRKYSAVEMEALGVMMSLDGRSCESMVIRGISDFCDHRKKEFDEFKDGAFRRLAVENALQLLTRFADLRLLKYSDRSPNRATWRFMLSGIAKNREELDQIMQAVSEINYDDFSIQQLSHRTGSVVLKLSSSQATANRMAALVESSTLKNIGGRTVLGLERLTGAERHEKELEHTSDFPTDKLEKMAQQKLLRGEYSLACKLQEILVNRLASSEGVRSTQALRALANLATFLRWGGNLAEAKRLLDFVIEKWQELEEDKPHRHWLWATRSNRAELLNKLGRPTEARNECRQILPRQRLVCGYQHSEVLATQNNLAEALRLTGEVTEAILLHHETLETRLDLNGWEDSDSTVSAWNLSLAYLAAGKSNEAIKLRQKLLWLLGANQEDLSPEQRKVRLLLTADEPQRSS